ncbi:unnamed protein product, partial [marine sediment metagenome]
MKSVNGKKEQKEEKYYVASQWQLMRRKFIKHKLAVMSIYAIGFLYFLGIFCEFISPYGTLSRFSKYPNAP